MHKHLQDESQKAANETEEVHSPFPQKKSKTKQPSQQELGSGRWYEKSGRAVWEISAKWIHLQVDAKSTDIFLYEMPLEIFADSFSHPQASVLGVDFLLLSKAQFLALAFHGGKLIALVHCCDCRKTAVGSSQPSQPQVGTSNVKPKKSPRTGTPHPAKPRNWGWYSCPAIYGSKQEWSRVGSHKTGGAGIRTPYYSRPGKSGELKALSKEQSVLGR